MPQISAIYAIRNSGNGKLYIGSAENYVKRINMHKSLLNRGKHHSVHLQRSFNKNGISCFDFSIIEYVDNKESLLDREQVWLDFFRPQYNISKCAGAPTRGMKFSEETRTKMSAARMGKKRGPMSAETKAKISFSKTGKSPSEEGLRSLREEHKNRFTPEYRKQWGAQRKGKHKRSEECKKKQSLRLLGNSYTKGMKFKPEAYDSRRGPRKKKEFPCPQ